LCISTKIEPENKPFVNDKKLLCIEDIIHNVIGAKIVIRRFLKYFRRQYRWRVKYWQHFDVLKDFHLVKIKDMS